VPRHAKVYRDLKAEYARLQREMTGAFGEFKADVDSGAYPAAKHVVEGDDSEYAAFMRRLG
jgi:3-methyl-2-oxobutanoate hydroxymethyltransferase